MWWFKRATLLETDPELQIMHPWFLDYGFLEEPVRELVRAMNNTDMVETLSSCGGHPELEEWLETTRAAFVMYRVTRPSRWNAVLERLRANAVAWRDIELIVEGRREQQIMFRVRPGSDADIRLRLDAAIEESVCILKGFVDADLCGLASRRHQYRHHTMLDRVTGDASA